MDFNELKTRWQNTAFTDKSHSELEMMTKINSHPKLKRIRIKLIIEVVLLVAFLAIYNNAFEGSDKPLIYNIILIISALLYILNDVTGYYSIKKSNTPSNIKQSLVKLRLKLSRLAVLSVSSSLFFGASVILLLTANIEFNTKKYFILAGIIITLIISLVLLYKNWKFRINQINKTMEEFNELEQSNN